MYPIFRQESGKVTLTKWVYNANSVDRPRFLHIFREEHTATCLLGGSHHQRIPERKSMKEVKVDRGQNVGYFGNGNIEFGEQLDLSPRDALIHAQLPRDRNEIFLENLMRHYAGARAPVLGNEIEGAPLFCRSSFIIRIN
jgi:hypothetical protein